MKKPKNKTEQVALVKKLSGEMLRNFRNKPIKSKKDRLRPKHKKDFQDEE